ncbi:MAG: hypothetical protein JWP29_2678 [Rhodoferax sp.]|nr:hypothetical protein [Rhodoferax sp.]
MSPIARWSARTAAAVTLCVAVAAAAAGARVQVYPSGPSIPENLLRIELRLAAPLDAPLDTAHVKLLDASGRTIDGAFLDVPLPSGDGMRMTLLLHPGRVKSGVGANLALGRALRMGSPVTLLIDDPALGTPVRKSWQVLAPVVSPVAPSSWTLTAPSAGARTPLVVRMHAAIASAAQDLVAVRAPDGTRLAGSASLADFETTWRFVPSRSWKPGAYALMVHPELEDPAGNRACASFESVGASRVDCRNGAAVSFMVKAGV